MRPEETIVYAAGVKVLEDAALYELARKRVSAERREKAGRFAFEKDRRLCIGAGLLLNKALSDAGVEPERAETVTDERGKPYLKGGGVFFSLSHSGETVLCAVSPWELGCDIEELGDADIAIAKRFFHENECRRIFSPETAEKRRELFFRYWTLKESFLKATGEGLRLPLNSFEISLEGNCIRVLQGYDGRDYSFAEFGEIPGYRAAVCTAKKDCVSELRQIDLWDCLKQGQN